MSVYIVIWILFAHWIGDYVLQSHNMAINKSSSWYYLFAHTATYSACIFVFMLGIVYAMPDFTWINNTELLLVTFLFHSLQDYITSRINKRLAEAKRDHDFYLCIGFDQLLHITQLIITFKLLIR